MLGVMTLGDDYLITNFGAVIATMAIIVSLVGRFWTPHEHLRQVTVGTYALLVLLVAAITLTTGAFGSPYAPLLALALVFAGLYGMESILITGVIIVALGVWQVSTFTTLEQLARDGLIGGIIPYILGFVLWARFANHGTEETTEDKSYHELATQLSQVAGKSEVVINAIGDGVIALNGKGTIELINPAAQRIIGWGKQDALSLDYKSVLKLVDAKNAELSETIHPVEKALQQNEAQESDVFSLVTSSGKNILISIVVSPIGQAGAGVIIVFRDITADKAEERQQAEFISTASHEMRTPVASIEGYLGLALNPATAQIDAKARDFITKAHASAEHLGRLFQDLLDVSKADDGRIGNNPKVVDIIPYIGEIASGLKPKADEKGLRFIYKPSPDDSATAGNNHGPLQARSLTPVYYSNIDNDHLREIVANLMENAIKYTLTGDVVVDVTGDDAHITISVADTGLGIPKEDQSHLFQKFYRVDSTDTREIGGTGLGLYLSRRLAETIGGRLWVESEYKKGSTFFLEIPRISHEEATHLIEMASIVAERDAQAKTNNTPVAQSPATFVPEPPRVTQAPPVAPPIAPVALQAPMPAPAPTVAPSPQASVQPVVPSALPNTPLSAIEANPRQYMQQRDVKLNVPTRPQ
jgi:PAS domain S-box-containing protein